MEHREKTKDKYFAEWFSINPAYPEFGPYKAGEHINGRVASFVAGELAKAALFNGFEQYGWDIIKRIKSKSLDASRYHEIATRHPTDNAPQIPIIQYFGDMIDVKSDERKGQITIYHLLTMTSGFYWPEFGELHFLPRCGKLQFQLLTSAHGNNPAGDRRKSA